MRAFWLDYTVCKKYCKHAVKEYDEVIQVCVYEYLVYITHRLFIAYLLESFLTNGECSIELIYVVLFFRLLFIEHSQNMIRY